MKLNVENINFSFDNKRILKNINFKVEEGQFVTFLGKSGSGKSTLLNIISGILANKIGNIYVDDAEINGMTEHFSYMTQDDLLLPWKTVIENITLYDKIHNNQRKENIFDLITLFGLKGYERKYPKHLSGGMKQRAAFLRTALCNSDIWLLDEPFGALDIITRQQMQDWLVAIRGEITKTMILVTHDVEEAIYLSDRIFILGGTPAEIVADIEISEDKRNRAWLFEKVALKKEIYDILKVDR